MTTNSQRRSTAHSLIAPAPRARRAAFVTAASTLASLATAAVLWSAPADAAVIAPNAGYHVYAGVHVYNSASEVHSWHVYRSGSAVHSWHVYKNGLTSHSW